MHSGDGEHDAYSESNRNVPSGMPFATWFGTATEEFTG